MKCIRCNHDSTYPQRTNRFCPQCRGAFAFEPREKDPFSDMLFKNAIDAVSAHGAVRFGVENLYYEVCRRTRRKSSPAACSYILFVIAVALAVAAGTNAPLRGMLILAIFVAVLGCINLLVRAFAWRASLDAVVFSNLYERWCKVHGAPQGVIQRREQPAPPVESEPDLGDYSFDRAVICDRARTVDLLLANNFHFENNCAILSFDGYPAGPFRVVKEMLKRNPKLQVFVLHDATPAGCQLARKLAHDREWFAGGIRIIDVGLRPGHARQFFGLWQAGERGMVAPGDGLSASEAKWLSSYKMELAAVRPQQVIRWLFRAVNSQAQSSETAAAGAGGDGGDGVLYYTGGEGDSFARDNEAVDADFDSFG